MENCEFCLQEIVIGDDDREHCGCEEECPCGCEGDETHCVYSAQHSVHPTAFGVCPHGVNLGNQVCSACEPEKFGGG